MIEHLATPYYLIVEQQNLSSVDTTLLNEEQLAAHLKLVEDNASELLKYGDQEMSPEREAAHLASQTAIAAESAAVSRRNAALNALEVGDEVARRCFKAGVPYPADWRARDVILRRIVDGEETEVPAQPAYPEGT